MHFWGIKDASATEKMFVPPVSLHAPQMQDTGLKDKNGKEIYEGDVIHMDYGSDFADDEGLSIIVGPVSYDEEIAAYGVRKGGTFNQLAAGEIEILGDIYHNPELLETKE